MVDNMTALMGKLREKPFYLDTAALAWVQTTFSLLSTEEKVGQILLPVCRDLSDEAINGVLAHHVGGLHRMIRRDEGELRGSARYAQSRTKVPLLMAGDIEFSEKSSPAAGTEFPNQMAVGATGDTIHAKRMGTIAAREGSYLGFNISWTPVGDLALNFRSSVVNTRAFGDDVEAVTGYVRAYHEGVREAGLGTCLKHWPGDGVDERDQHFVKTNNTMDMDSWRRSFGQIFGAAIANGVQSIMAGHISLPAYAAELGARASCQGSAPASLNRDLNIKLLRGELGFNGLIVSDATGMVGFGSQGKRSKIVPLCIEEGCDVLLFPTNLADDFRFLIAGLDEGILSYCRLDEAVLRVLALKASLGLHLDRFALPDERWKKNLLASPQHAAWADDVARAAVTLVKDTRKILPLRPEKHPRVLLSWLENRTTPSGPIAQLQFDRLLREAGFDVTILRPGEKIEATRYDVGVYVLAEEGMSAREHLGPRWADLHGPFPASMERLWDYLPTIYVSLGSPFLLYHMPECETFVNGYSPILPVQRATVAALTGKIPFSGQSPVDPSCGVAPGAPL
ncbi:glycoside hydrolase family 3 N-terminal domain-containing protein [Agrobacterium sp. B1(2019)]|uniref:glycoside hydrolase family 3 protein n=1 Tax=Agrobacterium sp. B1(2019) TaxID=2607032 RepID=UPI001FEDE11B|nr:glycoside hydrolase family 3 N-terminal domain-containing protein [Agrobacterium sp. B1(2019)]